MINETSLSREMSYQDDFRPHVVASADSHIPCETETGRIVWSQEIEPVSWKKTAKITGSNKIKNNTR